MTYDLLAMRRDSERALGAYRRRQRGEPEIDSAKLARCMSVIAAQNKA